MSSDRAAAGRAARLTLLLAAALSLSACGGDGGGTTAAGGGVGGTGLAAGSVTAFGSVIVNGVEYRTTALTIRRRLDDGPGNIAGLDNEVFRKGMVVAVHHGLADNDAAQIDYQNDLEGPAEGVSASGFTVLGQTVLLGPGTIVEFSGGAGPAIADNDVVEVSGPVDAAGAFRATYVQARPPGSKTVFEVKGVVSGLSGSPPVRSFTLKGLTVTTDGLTVLKDLPAGLAEGLFVEVKTADRASPLRAISVEGRQSVADVVKAAGEASVEGYVSGLSVNGNDIAFALSGVPVAATNGTPGAGSVAPNAHIQAEGAVVAGVLRAAVITPRP